MSSDRQAEGVQVGDRLLVLPWSCCRGRIGPQILDGHAKGVGEGLEHGQPLDPEHAALYLGDPTLGAADLRCELTLGQAATNA